MAVPDAALSEIAVNGPLTAEALAREYHPRSYADGYAVVEDYRRVMQRHAESGKKSAALASEMDLPRGRIRPWLDGAVPDGVRAIERAAELGWFKWDGSIAAAFATLFVGVRAGGSIGEQTRQVYFTVEPAEAGAMVAAALQQVGVGVREDAREGAADQVRPAHDGPLLGRALLALGAQTSHKNESGDPLPEWLLEAPTETRRHAATLYLLYRAHGFDGKDTLRLVEQRSPAYRESVVALFDGLVDGEVAATDYAVTISAQAARELGLGRGMALRSAIE